MTLVQLRDIGKIFGGTLVLDRLTWSLEEGTRVGLVGPNGSGKSTLLRILSGEETVDAGELSMKRGLRVSLLAQHVTGDERTPRDLARASRPDLEALSVDLDACERDLARPETYSEPLRLQLALERQERLVRRHAELGGSGSEGEARRYLLDLGLTDADLDLPMSVLSGGQRKIAMLALCFAQRPDLLLLDEPETHLDLPRRHLLERLIQAFEGAIVVVSHDRYLLDETVSQTAELENGRIVMWPGNYSAFRAAKEIALLRQQELFASQQKEIARLEEAVRRFQTWARMVLDERHIKQARVKQRQIDRMEKVDRPVLERRKMALSLHSGTRGGQKVYEVRSASIELDGRTILRQFDLVILRGERVGVVAPNGAGKTVLARLLTGELEPMSGEVWIGPSIKLGYFAQQHETLPAGATPLELVRDVQPLSEGQAVAKLMRFLFSYEQARQKVSTLSGGERSRLQLLLLMMSGANCLILDEPTNHLDVDSAEVLEAELEAFDGTAIVISHDRYFLDRITDRTVTIGDRLVSSHAGSYSEWAERARA